MRGKNHALLLLSLVGGVIFHQTSAAANTRTRPSNGDQLSTLYTHVRTLREAIGNVQENNPESFHDAANEAWEAISAAMDLIFDRAAAQLGIDSNSKPTFSRRLNQALFFGSQQDAEELLDKITQMSMKNLAIQAWQATEDVQNQIKQNLGLPPSNETMPTEDTQTAVTSALSSLLLQSVYDRFAKATSAFDSVFLPPASGGLSTLSTSLGGLNARRRLNDHDSIVDKANQTVHKVFNKMKPIMVKLHLKKNDETTEGIKRRALQQTTSSSSSSSLSSSSSGSSSSSSSSSRAASGYKTAGALQNQINSLLASFPAFPITANAHTVTTSSAAASPRLLELEDSAALLERYLQLQSAVQGVRVDRRLQQEEKPLQDEANSTPVAVEPPTLGDMINWPALEQSLLDANNNHADPIPSPSYYPYAGKDDNRRPQVMYVVQPMDIKTAWAFISDTIDMLKDIIGSTLHSAAINSQGIPINTGIMQLIPIDPSSYVGDVYNSPSVGEQGDQQHLLGDMELKQPLHTDSPSLIMRNRSLKSMENFPISSSNTNKNIDLLDYSEVEYGSYEEDEAWMWAPESADPDTTGDDIFTLVVSLISTNADGNSNTPPPLLQLMADDSWSSIGDLLNLLEEHARTVSASKTQAAAAADGATTSSNVELPRFNVFGATKPNTIDTLTSSGNTKQHASNMEQQAEKRKVVETIIMRQHHSRSDDLGATDANWFFLAGSLGLLGLVLMGTSLAAMRLSSGSAGDVGDVPVGGGGSRYAPAGVPVSRGAPSPEKENLLDVSSSPVKRRTSNLPA